MKIGNFEIEEIDGGNLILRIRGLTVDLIQHDEGLSVNVWGADDDEPSVASTWALWSEGEKV